MYEALSFLGLLGLQLGSGEPLLAQVRAGKGGISSTPSDQSFDESRLQRIPGGGVSLISTLVRFFLEYSLLSKLLPVCVA